MAIVAAQELVNGLNIPDTSGVLYTVPGTFNRMKLDMCRIVNHTAVPVTVNLWILQNGEIEADNFKVLVDYVLPGNGSELIGQMIGSVIDTGGVIRGLASVATSVSFSATGLGFTT